MKDRDVIRTIMEMKGISNASLARTLGITDAAIWDRLNTKKGKSLTTSNLSEMVQPLGFKVAVIPEEAEIPEGGYLVE